MHMYFHAHCIAPMIKGLIRHLFHDVETVEVGLLGRHDTGHHQFPDDQLLPLHHHSAASNRVQPGGTCGTWLCLRGGGGGGGGGREGRTEGGGRGRGGAENSV